MGTPMHDTHALAWRKAILFLRLDDPNGVLIPSLDHQPLSGKSGRTSERKERDGSVLRI
jgi:hypothetical protein